MNAPKVDELDYIHFLVAAQGVFSTTEAARTRRGEPDAPAHDTYTRLLKRIPPNTEALWREVAPFVVREQGVLVVDDTTLDKPYARKMALVTRHWSGKHGRVVQGINLISLLWIGGQERLPCDFRIYNRKEDGLTKNDHFRAMLRTEEPAGIGVVYCPTGSCRAPERLRVGESVQDGDPKRSRGILGHQPPGHDHRRGRRVCAARLAN